MEYGSRNSFSEREPCTIKKSKTGIRNQNLKLLISFDWHLHKTFTTLHCNEQRGLAGAPVRSGEEEWISTILELLMCRTIGIILLQFYLFLPRRCKGFVLLRFSWVVWTLNSIFVATWNVAGRSPPSNLSLDDWLHSSPPADIYVLG